MKCQACQTAHAQVYCQESQAALCKGCSYVMGDITRFRLCALCECNPARVFCHNDNAALCESCDADIHLSNPLAVRHDRVPLGPLASELTKDFFGCTNEGFAASDSDSCLERNTPFATNSVGQVDADASVLFVPKGKASLKDYDVFDLDHAFFGSDLLDFSDEFCQAPSSPSDGVVPTMELMDSSASSNASSQDYSAVTDSPKAHSKLGAFSSSQEQVSDSLSYVPAMPAIPTASQAVNGGSLSPSNSTYDMPTLHVGSTVALDREARVMRYREKRKRRTFEKTIRYQSRKAYAEVRPRIKGRFATKEEVAAMKIAAASNGGSLVPVCA
ncbi:g3291 [Coccomyxa elongata]